MSPKEQEFAATIIQHLDDRRFEAAVDLATAALGEISDGQGRALVRIMEALDKQRQDTMLASFAETVAAHGLLPVESGIFRLRVAFRAGDYSGALAIADAILAASNRNIEALRTGGRIGNLMRDDAVALRFWLPLADISPLDPEAALQTARIHLRAARHADAFAYAAKAVAARQDKTEALHIATQAGLQIGWPESSDVLLVALFGADHAAALRVTQRLASSFDPAIAARSLAVIHGHLPDDPAVAEIVEVAAAAWLAAGLEHELALRDRDAAVHLNAARLIQPDNTQARHGIERLNAVNLAAMRHAVEERDFQAAAEYSLAAARIDPDCLDAWQIAGRSLFSLGRSREALSAFRRCTQLDPGNARHWLTLGIALNREEDRVTAYQALRRASELAEDDAVAGEAKALIDALLPALLHDADAAADSGALEAAWQCFDTAAAIRPDDAAVEAMRKRLLRLTREAIRALWETRSPSVVPLCHALLGVAPDDRQVRTVLARTLIGMRAYGDALPEWETLRARDPADSHIQLQIARCCRALGLVERGIEAAAAARRLDPALQEAADIERALATA